MKTPTLHDSRAQTNPHNLDAEQAVLGALIFDNALLEKLPTLTAEMFYDPCHGRLFQHCARRITRGMVADALTLKDFAREDAGIKEIGGEGYLLTLVENAARFTSQAIQYADIIRDTHARRTLIKAAQEALGSALRPSDEMPLAEIVDKAESAFRSVLTGDGGADIGLRDAASIVTEALRKPLAPGVSSGLAAMDRTIGGFYAPDLIVIAGRPAMGKAQPLDSNVLMADGAWRAMADLKPGDRVASVDGADSRIVGIYPQQGDLQSYRITLSDGRSCEACGEHLWLVRYREWPTARVLSTDTLREMLTRSRYRNRLWIDPINGRFGEHRSIGIDPWLLGVWLGNGTGATASFQISTASPTLEQNLRALGEHTGYALVHQPPYEFRLTTPRGKANPLLAALRDLGVANCGSHEKFIPEVCFSLPDYDRLALLRGILDTDGWAERFGCTRYSSASAQLAQDVARLARSLGCWVGETQKAEPIYTYKGERRRGRTAYILTISGRQDVFREPHKLARISSPRRFHKRLTIASITPTRIAPMQCIQVSHPSHLYITDGYIPTHNTSLAVNLAVNVARASKVDEDGQLLRERVVAFFSMEMSAEQLAGRALARSAMARGNMAFSYSDLRSRKRPHADHVAKLTQGLPDLLRINERGAHTIASLRAACRDIRSRYKALDLIVVDYLQLMADSSGRKDGRVQEITAITGGLKALAKDMQCPVIALSQLSRAVEMRQDKHPQLSDLRESGSIEQDADIVLMVYREHYYLMQQKPQQEDGETKSAFDDRELEWDARVSRSLNKMEVIVAKNRHGQTGSMELWCDLAADAIQDSSQPSHSVTHRQYWADKD